MNVPPAHRDDTGVDAVTDAGIVVIASAAVVTVVVPQLLVATMVYIPADGAVTVKPAGLRPVAVYPPGPLHE